MGTWWGEGTGTGKCHSRPAQVASGEDRQSLVLSQGWLVFSMPPATVQLETWGPGQAVNKGLQLRVESLQT